MPKMQSLEGLRGCAALMVVMFHVQAIMATRLGVVPFGGAFADGSRGVDLFFVLSGFIMTFMHRPDWDHPARIGDYAWKRVTRIYPNVWVLSAFAIGVYATGFHGLGHTSKLTAGAIVCSVLLLPQHGDPLVNVTWTLKYEMWFYAVFAATLLDKRIGIALLAAWQAAILICAVAGWTAPVDWIAFYLRPICLEFGIGVACAMAVPFIQARRVAFVLLMIGLAQFIAAMVFETRAGEPLAPFQAVAAFGSAAGLIIAGAAALDRGDFYLPRFVTYLGGASYSIYLVHFSAISLAAAALVRAHVAHAGNLLCGAVASISVLAGAAFYTLFDRPVGRWLAGRGFFSKQTKPHTFEFFRISLRQRTP